MSKRIVILGGGLAGLCAGWALREQSRGELDVEVIERGHLLGGKASSMPHEKHERVYEVEHGYHAFFDYPNLAHLLGRFAASAGLKANRHRIFMFWRGRMRSFQAWPLPAPLHLLPTLWIVGPSVAWHFFRFYLAAALLRIDRIADAERKRLDELTMQQYARQLGMPDELIDTELFRFFSRSAFNWPFPTSALSMLRAIRLVSQDYDALRVRYLDGPSGDVIVDPIARAYANAGGRLRRYTFVERIKANDGKVAGVKLRERRQFPHRSEARAESLSFYHTELPFSTSDGPDETDQPAETLEADFYVSALPPKDLLEVLDGDTRALPYFDRVSRIEVQPTIAYQIHYDRIVTPPDFTDALVGIPGPFSTIFDRSRVWNRPDGAGSVIEMVGELGDYTGRSPDELMQLGDAQVMRFFPQAGEAEVLERWFHEGRHDAFTMTTAGSDKLRPPARSPLLNLVLAGDFTGNSFGVMSMEGAATSGLEAANVILEATGYPAYPIRKLRTAGGLLPGIRWILKVLGLLERTLGYREAG